MRYEPSLDGLRALAICAVVTYHSSPHLPGGWAGVDVFFVLSGFLITRLLLAEWTKNGTIDLKAFYIRRSLRLMPAFGCLLAFQIVRLLLSPNHKTQIVESTGISAIYLMNWSRAFNWLPQDIIGHTWSLSMEEQFYLLWPAIFLLTGFGRTARFVGLATVIVVLWRCYLAVAGADPERTYNGFDTHSDSILIGCIVALIPLSAKATKIAANTVIVPITIFAFGILFIHHRSIYTQTIGLTVASLLSAWLIVASLEAGRWKNFLSTRPLVYTGKLSYAWYLWHYPLIALGGIYFPHIKGMIFAALSYLIAVISYHLVEMPALRLKSRLRFRNTDLHYIQKNVEAEIRKKNPVFLSLLS